MNILLTIGVVVVIIVVVASIFFDAGKARYQGVPMSVENAVLRHYKILSCVKAENGESFAVVERKEDEEILCINVTPLKEEALAVGKWITL